MAHGHAREQAGGGLPAAPARVHAVVHACVAWGVLQREEQCAHAPAACIHHIHMYGLCMHPPHTYVWAVHAEQGVMGTAYGLLGARLCALHGVLLPAHEWRL